MTIVEALNSVAELKDKWPAGINFSNKSRFLGFSHKGVGGVPDVVISVDMIESDKWGFLFRPMDKATVAALNGLFEAMAPPSASKVMAAGFEHPCREACAGWRQGYDRGRYESREEIARLKRICRDLASSSKSKATQSTRRFWGKYFDETTEADE